MRREFVREMLRVRTLNEPIACKRRKRGMRASLRQPETPLAETWP
jgi:hypothetical protein